MFKLVLSKHFSERNSAWPESTTVILIHAPGDLQLTRWTLSWLSRYNDDLHLGPGGYFVPQKTA